MPNRMASCRSPWRMLGGVVTGVTYTVVSGDHYQLTATIGDVVELYDSSQSVQEWVGEAAGGKLLGGS
jgi:hypothetical protein